MLTQITRSTASLITSAAAAASKRSIASTVVRSFANEDPKFQFEKAHHQVAPLTDPTLYAPHGYHETNTASTSSASSQNANNTTASSVPSDTLFHNDTNSIFTPSVNAVFDD